MKEYSENATSFKRDKEAKLAVIIIDRREDPVTPLLNQWTYQVIFLANFSTEFCIL